jgi:hypothetical protein
MDLEEKSIEKGLTTPRAAAVAGIVFAVLASLCYVLVWKSVPDNPLGIADHEIAHLETLSTAFNLAPFAGIAFLWFIAVLRNQIGRFEDRFFTTVVLGSGLLYLAMFFACGALAGGLLRVLSTQSIIDFGAYAIARAQIYQIANVYAVKLAGVFMLSTSTVALRTGIVPRWMIYLGYLLALFLILAIGSIHWAPIVFPLWVLLISICILVEKFQPQQA